MHRDIARAVFIVMPLARAPQALGAEPPVRGTGLETQVLRTIKGAAEQLRDGQRSSCKPVPDGAEPPPENLAAAIQYDEIAVMFGLAALQQPRIAGEQLEMRAAQIQDKLDAAVDARSRAYECMPGSRGVYHLHAALDLLRVWQYRLREVEKLPNDAPNHAQVARKIAELTAKLPVDHAAPCRRQACRAHVDPPLAAAPPGYARLMDLLVLRVEIGLGGGALLLSGARDRVLGPVARLSAGIRVLGAKRRHAILLGGFYSLQHLTKASSESYHLMNAGGLWVEWEIRVGDGAVSFHPALDLAAQSVLGEVDSFGRFQVGGALGLCVADQILCLFPRPFTSVQAGGALGFRGYQINVGLDVFRLVDRRRRRTARAFTE